MAILYVLAFVGGLVAVAVVPNVVPTELVIPAEILVSVVSIALGIFARVKNGKPFGR